MIDIDDGLLAPDDIAFDFASLDLPDSGDLFDAPEWGEPFPEDDGSDGDDPPMPEQGGAFTFALDDGTAIAVSPDDEAAEPRVYTLSDAELARAVEAMGNAGWVV
jgi:hypothetical protein